MCFLTWNCSWISSLCLLLFQDIFHISHRCLIILSNEFWCIHITSCCFVGRCWFWPRLQWPPSQSQSTSKSTFCMAYKMSFKYVGWPLPLLKYTSKSTLDSQPLSSLSYIQTSSQWRGLFFWNIILIWLHNN